MDVVIWVCAMHVLQRGTFENIKYENLDKEPLGTQQSE